MSPDTGLDPLSPDTRLDPRRRGSTLGLLRDPTGRFLMRHIQSHNPFGGDLLGRIPPDLLALWLQEHPFFRAPVKSDTHPLTGTPFSSLVTAVIEVNLAGLVHQAPPRPLFQPATHPLQLPLLRLARGIIRPAPRRQLRIGFAAALTSDRRIHLALKRDPPIQALLQLLGIPAGPRFYPAPDRALGAFYHAILLGTPGWVPEQFHSQPDQPQPKRGGQVRALAPRSPVVHPQPLGQPRLREHLSQACLNGAGIDPGPRPQGGKPPRLAGRRRLHRREPANSLGRHSPGAPSPWHPSATPRGVPGPGPGAAGVAGAAAGGDAPGGTTAAASAHAGRPPAASAAGGRNGSRRLPRWDGAAATRERRDGATGANGAPGAHSGHSRGRGVPVPRRGTVARSSARTTARGARQRQRPAAALPRRGVARWFVEPALGWHWA